MTESRELALVVDGRLDERLVERALKAAGEGAQEDRIRNGLDAVIDIAELDPEEAREALWMLQGDQVTLERLESCLGMGSGRATLALGGAIQLARAELSTADPDLRSRVPELLRWLEWEW